MVNNRDRKPRTQPARRAGGSVVIGVLVFVVIIAVLLGGIASFVASHSARAVTDSHYAHALYLAEAGLNYEIYKLSQSNSLLVADQKYQPGGALAPLTVYQIPIPGANGSFIPGQFTVSVRTDNPNDPNDTTPDTAPWYPPQPVIIESTGTAMPGTPVAVSRTLRIRAARSGIFDNFTFFGINSVTSHGTSGTIAGQCGTDCAWSVSGQPLIIGTLTFNGYPSGTFGGGTVTGGIFYQPDPVIWPTVDQIADASMSLKTGAVFSPGTGLAYIKTHNDNAQIQVFTDADASNVTSPPSDLTRSAGATTSSYDMGSLFTKLKDGNPGDQAGGNRFAYPTTTYTYTNPSNTVTVSGYGISGLRVLILPSNPNGTPRDYYFESVGWNGSQALLVDNSHGLVRIWLGPAGSSNGSDFSGTMLVSSRDPSKFRIYDAQAGALTLGGGNILPGGIYAWNGNNTGTITIGGNPSILGSLIAGNFTGNGNMTVIAPNPGANVDPSDYSLWYGFTAEFDETSSMAH